MEVTEEIENERHDKLAIIKIPEEGWMEEALVLQVRQLGI